MNPTLQRWIDEVLETSGQQWVLRLIAVVAPVGALLAAAAENGEWWPLGLVAVTMLAIASSIRPDTHIASTMVVVIVWHWLVTVERLDTPWLPVAGICLLVFHGVTALAATIPTGGRLPVGVLWRWSRSIAGVAAATVATWGALVAFERREAAGNGLLTGAALAVVAIAAVVVWSRSVESRT